MTPGLLSYANNIQAYFYHNISKVIFKLPLSAIGHENIVIIRLKHSANEWLMFKFIAAICAWFANLLSKYEFKNYDKCLLSMTIGVRGVTGKREKMSPCYVNVVNLI